MAVAFVAATTLNSCGYQPGSGLCEETHIEVQPLVVKATQKPVTLPARLTTKKGGRPIAGAELEFSNRILPPWAPDQPTGSVVGVATTGADGRAEFVEAAGVKALVLGREGTRLVGYIVELRQITPVAGEHYYCHSRATAEITVEA